MSNKRILAFLLLLVMLFASSGCKGTQKDPATKTPASSPTATVDVLSTVTPKPKEMLPVTNDTGKEEIVETINNLLTEEQSTFDGIEKISQSGWTYFKDGKVELSLTDGVDGSQCLKYTGGSTNYSSPMLNLQNYIKEAGEYKISFMVKLGGEDVDTISGSGFAILVRGLSANDANTFIVKSPTSENYRYVPSATIDGDIDDWMTVEFSLSVFDEDIDGKKHNWILCMHTIDEKVEEIYIDNVQVGTVKSSAPPEVQKLVSTAETWVANEMTFIAEKKATDPINTQTLDVIFTDGTTTLKVPGFWDGESIWRVRFALPNTGTWTFKTEFSDTSDTGVHGITGSISCSKYSGDLDIYKHGFVKTDASKRYFVYADGTPFFYLGDTHWNMLAEEYDKAGSKAGDINTVSHFKYIVNKRVAQGYTVYQSEPIGASFDLSNGIGAGDIAGFKVADKYFKYIADMGLVHANAQFFFADIMFKNVMTMENYEEYLDTISRYWVARFGAYPVMWTLAQEVDNDFYYMENQKTNATMNALNNPWKLVCESIYKYDPYKNPISGHQEGAITIINNTSASNSAFRDTVGHTWWASQWKPKLNEKLNFSAAQDYWASGQGKPSVVYEGRYASLWTNEYGARAQGWLAFLNGMYGHGYGAVDIWLYNSTYDIENDTVRDGITVTVEEKLTPWSKSIEFASGYQMGYMKDFLEQFEWWNLVPVFDNKDVFVSETGTYSFAKINDKVYIGYLYDDISKEGTRLSGTLKGLDENAEYTYYWFNPRTAVSGTKLSVKKTDGDKFVIGEKPSNEDWVIVVEKVK